MLITEEYRELNRTLHIEKPRSYGVSGKRWANAVQEVVRARECKSVLDYGCGKQTLAREVSLPTDVTWQDYDPCISGLDARPSPADLVVCGDVLEHIEPECIDAVLADIASLAKKAAYLVVAIVPAIKSLPDGRNAHLIVEPLSWWGGKLGEHFTINPKKVRHYGVEFAMIVEPRRNGRG